MKGWDGVDLVIIGGDFQVSLSVLPSFDYSVFFISPYFSYLT